MNEGFENINRDIDGGAEVEIGSNSDSRAVEDVGADFGDEYEENLNESLNTDMGGDVDVDADLENDIGQNLNSEIDENINTLIEENRKDTSSNDINLNTDSEEDHRQNDYSDDFVDNGTFIDKDISCNIDEDLNNTEIAEDGEQQIFDIDLEADENLHSYEIVDDKEGGNNCEPSDDLDLNIESNITSDSEAIENPEQLEFIEEAYEIEQELLSEVEENLEENEISDIDNSNRFDEVEDLFDNEICIEESSEREEKEVFEVNIENEVLSDILIRFNQEKWDQLSQDDQKEAITQLADCIENDLGIENRPDIVYYYIEDKSDFGYSCKGELGINEFNMDNSVETVDTVAHECRHQYQREHAADPQSELDYEFRENFKDIKDHKDDYQAYLEQILERDAREYAQRIKDQMG